jgi:hypothetical protein
MGLSAMHPFSNFSFYLPYIVRAFILRPSHSSWALLVLKNEGLQALILAIKGGVIIMYMAVPADRVGFLGLGRDGFGHL